MSNTKVRIVMICWSVAMVTALSCYRPTPPKVTVTKEQLIAKLVEKGDHAATALGTRDTAYAAYRFAAFYAPGDKSIATKLDAAKKMPIGLVANVPATNDMIARLVTPEDLRDFPPATPDTDMINLKMLLDESLVGDLSYTNYSAGQRVLFATFPPHDSGAANSDEVCVFTKEALYSLDSVRGMYGAPTTEVNGATKSVWTYGRFRLVGDSSHYVRLVLFPLFPSS